MVVERKSVDYKTGAAMHRVVTRDIDPRAMALMARQKLLDNRRQDLDDIEVQV